MEKKKLSGRYCIVGVGEAEVGRASPGQTALTSQAKAAQQAMIDCGVKPSDIDAVFSHWDDRAASLLLSEYLGIKPKYTDSTLLGGQSNLTHLVHAIAALEAGLCDVVLIAYGSTQRLDKSRKMSGLVFDQCSPSGQFIDPYGMVNPIGFYAMQAQLHKHRYGSTAEDLGEVAIAASKWAQLNPKAIERTELTMEQYLASPMICDPLRKHDICKITDYAGAIVVTSIERALDLKTKPVKILGFGEKFCRHVTPFDMGDWLDNGVVSDLTRETLEMAGCGRKDIDVIQIYDAFTIGVITGLEELGFCEKGEAGELVREGRIAPGGELPLNTSGGGLAYNHPGNFGMPLMIEAIHQLRGDCGDRQVEKAKTCLMMAGGFIMSAYIVMLFGTEGEEDE